MKTLVRKIESIPSCKIIFTDFFDTLVHRTVHPNYCIKLWAKFLTKELGLYLSSDELFAIRIDALRYLAKKQDRSTIEVSYDHLIKEVHARLVNGNYLLEMEFASFKKIFEQADYISEVSVQFKNDDIINSLKVLKEKGFRIYLITDFFFSKALIQKIVDFHGISAIFDNVFVSADLEKSKEHGNIYPYVLTATNSNADEVIMIGDNKKSDVINAAKNGIKSIHTKNKKHHFRNKKNLFGNDNRRFRKICSTVEKRCGAGKHAFSKYIIHFYFFTERLYKKSKRDGVKDLFFLAREGLYLKKLFDFYQELNQFNNEDKIQTHYLKASRQSAHQIALRPLEEEDFQNLGKSHAQKSFDQLFDWFLFSEKIKLQIFEEIKIEPNKHYPNLFDSEAMQALRENELFQTSYEQNRVNQKEAFQAYITAFGADIEGNGIALVDVGWGGTMQERIYDFFKQKIPVTGYYIGLKEIYTIEPGTKRFGLNFSLYPSHDISYDILKANGQLYEQLLGAPHGSTLGYSLKNNKPETIEFHEENEKYVFETYISDLQDYMLIEFEKLFIGLRPVDYSKENTQDYMTNMALRAGILTNKKKLKFIHDISKGFYQNVGENKVGLAYSPNQLRSQKRALLLKFLITPEKVFRFLVKVKPYMYAKGIFWLSWPINLAYYYMKFNFWLKKKLFPKKLIR